MKTFKDNAGCTWTMSVNVDPIKRARSAQDVNLMAAYMDRVLAYVQGEARAPLPGDAKAAAVEFLTHLARHGRIQFLADDLASDEAQAGVNQTTEACPCAGKLA